VFLTLNEQEKEITAKAVARPGRPARFALKATTKKM
jgi:hypothetical protein